MCELLGMSANVPTDLVFSFTGLMQRGGGTGPHGDGWGIAFYEGRGVRLFHDPAPAQHSEIAQLLARYPIKSQVVVGHVRQANVGAVTLANTHPFVRELWGQYWCFAHNGQLPGFTPQPGAYAPVGDTDSEAVFCDLLGRLRGRFEAPPDEAALLAELLDACAQYREYGVFNILLSSGAWLFCYCTTQLSYITRRAPFGPARLKDADVTVDFSAQTTDRDVVSVIATTALTTDETWHACAPGDWLLWRDGEIAHRGNDAPPEAA